MCEQVSVWAYGMWVAGMQGCRYPWIRGPADAWMLDGCIRGLVDAGVQGCWRPWIGNPDESGTAAFADGWVQGSRDADIVDSWTHGCLDACTA